MVQKIREKIFIALHSLKITFIVAWKFLKDYKTILSAIKRTFIAVWSFLKDYRAILNFFKRSAVYLWEILKAYTVIYHPFLGEMEKMEAATKIIHFKKKLRKVDNYIIDKSNYFNDFKVINFKNKVMSYKDVLYSSNGKIYLWDNAYLLLLIYFPILPGESIFNKIPDLITATFFLVTLFSTAYISFLNSKINDWNPIEVLLHGLCNSWWITFTITIISLTVTSFINFYITLLLFVSLSILRQIFTLALPHSSMK